jgi:hypothetical protein
VRWSLLVASAAAALLFVPSALAGPRIDAALEALRSDPVDVAILPQAAEGESSVRSSATLST